MFFSRIKKSAAAQSDAASPPLTLSDVKRARVDYEAQGAFDPSASLAWRAERLAGGALRKFAPFSGKETEV